MNQIACYVRVSTVGQNEVGQRREIEKWLAGNGIDPRTVLWFVDKESGDTLRRPAFERLQREIFKGAVKTVVIWRLDRVSRKMRDGINVLCEWCDKGLRVVSVTQQIDLSGTVGKMIAAVLLGVAEMEQETRRERQQMGIKAAKERGVYRGRKAGSTKGKPETARRMQEQGLSVPEIAGAMGVSAMTVRRYLRGAPVEQLEPGVFVVGGDSGP